MKRLLKTTCLLLAVCSLTFVACDKDDDGSKEQEESKEQKKEETKMQEKAFSVAQGKYVKFSHGNLQYTTTGTHLCADGTTQKGTWRFAPNQYDAIGSGNANASSSYTGWIDLFGWGTSGYNNKYPYMTSTTTKDYGDGEKDIAQTNYDWGIYNTIGSDAPGTWRTLTDDEWFYLSFIRTNASKLYGIGTVCGVNGCVLLPDDWILPTGVTFKAGVANDYGSEYYKTVNNYTLSEWQKMEANGAVFLPTAGYRNGTRVGNVGSGGGYWSASSNSSSIANYFYFYSHNVNTSSYGRLSGRSVRLVSDFK